MKIIKIVIISLIILIIAVIGLSTTLHQTSPTQEKAQITIDHLSTITDIESIESAITALKTPITVIEEPDLENLRVYASLPYYFAQPNILIIKDRGKFMKDLGYAVTKNILSLHYPEQLTESKPNFVVIPKSDLPFKYRELELKRFRESKLNRQKQIDSNDKIIANARIALANDPSQLTALEKQAATIKQQILKYIAEEDRVIRDISTPSGELYRKSEIITGAFVPPSTIMFSEPAHSDKNTFSGNVDEIMRTIIHESLHYYGNAESSVYLSPFFYEAFTEYLTLKALDRKDDSMYLSSGYPLHTQIMTLVAEKIPLSMLEKIHFTQDGTLFESVFKTHFPSTDYESFMQVTEKINALWFSNPAKPNNEYKDHPYILEAKKILGM